MSEFTSGILFRHAFKESACCCLEERTCLIEFDENWLCRLSDYDSEYLGANKYSESLLKMSETVPMLLFVFAEDYSSGFEILHNREVHGSVFLDWGLYGSWLHNTFGKLYGEEYFLDHLTPEEVEERLKKVNEIVQKDYEAYLNAKRTEFSSFNWSDFKDLDFDDKTVNSIKEIFNADLYPDNIKDYSPKIEFEMIEKFKEAVGLTYFEWISKDYADHHDDERIKVIAEKQT